MWWGLILINLLATNAAETKAVLLVYLSNTKNCLYAVIAVSLAVNICIS
jgi:hypothetical protein